MEFIQIQKYLIEDVKNAEQFNSLLRELIGHLCMFLTSLSLSSSYSLEERSSLNSFDLSNYCDLDLCCCGWLASHHRRKYIKVDLLTE